MAQIFHIRLQFSITDLFSKGVPLKTLLLFAVLALIAPSSFAAPVVVSDGIQGRESNDFTKSEMNMETTITAFGGQGVFGATSMRTVMSGTMTETSGGISKTETYKDKEDLENSTTLLMVLNDQTITYAYSGAKALTMKADISRNAKGRIVSIRVKGSEIIEQMKATASTLWLEAISRFYAGFGASTRIAIDDTTAGLDCESSETGALSCRLRMKVDVLVYPRAEKAQ